ncbi:hypothetical protein B0H11DRAFT_1900186 [Mycena galericulata]|nr:hypothetical protein B0H11DRAFT_1900186 [Mycena galericulata]
MSPRLAPLPSPPCVSRPPEDPPSRRVKPHQVSHSPITQAGQDLKRPGDLKPLKRGQVSWFILKLPIKTLASSNVSFGPSSCTCSDAFVTRHQDLALGICCKHLNPSLHISPPGVEGRPQDTRWSRSGAVHPRVL